MAKAIKEPNLINKFTEHDLIAKASSDLDTDFDAQKLLCHRGVALTEKHYRRKEKVVDPIQGFLLWEQQNSILWEDAISMVGKKTSLRKEAHFWWAIRFVYHRASKQNPGNTKLAKGKGIDK